LCCRLVIAASAVYRPLVVVYTAAVSLPLVMAYTAAVSLYRLRINWPCLNPNHNASGAAGRTVQPYKTILTYLIIMHLNTN